MKLSGPVAAGIIVAAVVVILIVGFFYVRHATGSDAADQLHADIKKLPSGRPPFTAAQIEQMKRQGASLPKRDIPTR